jgi:maleylacetate reductase
VGAVESFGYETRAQRVLFGVGVIDRLPGEIDRLGAHRVLLIAGGSAKATGDDVSRLLAGTVAGRFEEVRQHVPERLVEAARAAAVGTYEADAVVAVGGGSAIGLAKALAVGTGLPALAVPTTYSGSEVSDVYGITGAHKRTARDPRALPAVVLYDPELTVDLSPYATGTTGFNALAHCVEALYASGTNPIARLHAQEGIRLLADALPDAVAHPGDRSARGRALLGAYLAGSAFASAGSALHHKLCHVLGGTFGLVHGEVNAVLLPYVVAYNRYAAPEAMRRTARALHATDPVDALRSLAVALALPISLAEIGMPHEGLGAAAERAAVAVGTANPRAVDLPSLRQLLDDAYHGRDPSAPEGT